ncbi:MAG: hypothetical protein SGI83_09290 [Bacteroidota bacterium]|nr:hypothetical protein [Bacteroidota bacterium]
MKKHVFYYLAIIMVLIAGCQKELSFELGNTPAKGSLQSDISGDCLPKTVNGVYEATKPLVPTTNTITVSVIVTRTGIYTITTDTVNGYYFRATGTFTALGATTVTLRSNGTPFVVGIDNFVVSYDGTVCDIAVEVFPAGAGGPAVFTLVSGGSPVNCATAVVSGTYVKDAVVGATNYVDVTVNITMIGTYNIRATGGGMIFQKTGASFTATGNQTVRLQATGTPTVLGANTITFDAPFASCSFSVTVSGLASYTIDCPNVTVQGTYQVGVPLTAGNTVTVPITAVATPGAYSITATVGGMTFSASGNLTVPTSIVLNPTLPSTPTTAGPNILSFGTPACSVTITVTAAPVFTWKFNIGATVYQGTTAAGGVLFDFTSLAPATLLDFSGVNAASDDFSFTLIDLTGGITATETYTSISIGLTNASAFYFINGAGTIDLTAEPGAPPVGLMVFTVISHNVATKTITGTFSGSAFDAISSTSKIITNGTFTAVYP